MTDGMPSKNLFGIDLDSDGNRVIVTGRLGDWSERSVVPREKYENDPTAVSREMIRLRKRADKSRLLRSAIRG